MKQEGLEGKYLHRLQDSLDWLVSLYNKPESPGEEIRYFAGLVSSELPLGAVTVLYLDKNRTVAKHAEWICPGEHAGLETCDGAVLSACLRSLGPGESERLPCGENPPELFPVFEKGALAGAFLFWKAGGKVWTAEEKKTLSVFSFFAGLSVGRRERTSRKELSHFVFNSMLDSLSASVYVTNIRTDEILFMNKSMKREFGIQDPEGKVCWKVLQKGMEKRCEFCPIERLLEGSGGSFCKWEEKNTVTGRYYENYDSLIQWVDGSLVHLQQSIDVTESRQMAAAARFDELTGFLDRRFGKEELSQALAKAKRENQPVTLALYDVNVLKEINDTYGHREGDELLRVIAEEAQKKLAPGDVAFRLGGDEFVLAFYGKTEHNVFELMKDLAVNLGRRRQSSQKPYQIGFCYGIQGVFPEDNLTLDKIIALADEKMYERKKRFHILKRDAELKKAGSVTVENGQFSYEKEYLYDALVQSTDNYIYVCDIKTGAFRYPKSMVEEFDLPGEIIKNAAAVLGEKVHAYDKQAFLESNQEIEDGRTDTHLVEYRAKNRRGEWVWLRCRGHVERDEHGTPRLFAGVITNLGQKNKIDHVTGLFNRFEFENEIRRRASSSVAAEFSILLLDIDDFKNINDLYNRVFGDEIIRITAQKIQTLLPRDTPVYRLDGDEFGIVVNGGDESRVRKIYSAICENFGRQQEYDGKKYFCTLSAGCVFYPRDAATYEDLFKFAEYCLDYSKNNGKNRITLYTEEILAHKERSLELTELMRESMEQGYRGFELYYQPQVNASSKQVVGAEALARWRCDKYGEVSPVEFIPILEESGLIVPAGKWIFYQAAKKCREWRRIQPDFVMSINLSYLQVADPDFLPFLRRTLTSLEVDPANLVVEFTESYLVKNGDSLHNIFDAIRSLGIKIAMDDFGTGYSSLEVLKKAPADTVKIDRAFIKDIRTSSFDATFIRFIVELCHDVGIEVCLEGVESPEEYQIVSPMNLDYIQGFLFGRPEPAESFERKFMRI